MKKLLVISLAALVMTLSGCSKILSLFTGGEQKEEEILYVYSIIHDEETKALTDLFTQKTGIPVKYMRATTGELVNRIIAEKDDPQADILLGGASSYHIQADNEGALENYVSPLAEGLPGYAVSEKGTWTGFCALTLGIGVNQKIFNEKFPGKNLPETWDDLLKPEFDQQIVVTNPVASSTAYLFVQNQLQRLGWDKGWEYLLKLAPLVGQFPESGGAPAKLIGTGEYAIGVSYLHALAKYRAQGFDVISIAPPKSVVDVDCVSITKNSKHPEAARKFVDFMLSKEAQELMTKLTLTTPINPQAELVDGVVSITNIDSIEYDVQKASDQKKEVLDKWSKNVK